MTDHTPGPWSFEEDQGIIDIKIGSQSDRDRFAYARLFLPTWDHSRPDEQDRANARLMTASPQLFDVVETLVMLARDDEHSPDMAWKDAFEAAERILARLDQRAP